MNVLVTGGTGFIGGHVVLALLEAGHGAHAVDWYATNAFSADELTRAGASFALRDVHDLTVHNLGGADAVIHLAGPVGPAGVLNYPGGICAEIVGLADRVGRIARSAGARLVNVSTSEAWGGGTELTREQPSLIAPGWTARREYGVGKLAAEHVIAGLCNAGLNAITVRPFNIAGGRQDPRLGFVLPRFIDAALDGLPLTVFGDGKQRRAFMDVRDFARLLVELATAALRMNGAVISAGNPANETTVGELAHMVAQVGGSTVTYINGRDVFGPGWHEADGATKTPARALDPPAWVWTPRIGLFELIADAVLWRRTLRGEPSA